jgi:uncharacterized protein YutD
MKPYIQLAPNKVYRPTFDRKFLPIMFGAASPESITEVLDNYYSTTWQLMRGEAVDNIFNATPLWYWLNKRGRIRKESGGRWIGVQVMYGKNTTVSSIAPGAEIELANPQIVTTAQYNWKYVAGSLMRLFSEDTENKNKEAIMNLAETKLKNLELSMIDALETMVFGDGTGNSGLDLLGIQALVQNVPTANPASGAVGGIDAATNTYWQNKTRTWEVAAMPSGDNSYAYNFRKLYTLCSIGNDHPTLGIGHSLVYENYESALTQLLQVYDRDMGDAGFEALRYKGMAITYSPSAPETEIRFLNERYLEFIAESSAYFYMTPWKTIPKQLDRVAQVVVKGELTTSNRRMQGVLHTIS